MKSDSERYEKKYTLRPYQINMVNKILDGFRGNNPFIAVGATAMGKSLVIADVAARLGEPILVLAPSKEILEQNYEKMQSYGLDVTMYSASVGVKEIGHITIATIQSIYKTPEKFKHFKYIIFDEVHLFNAKGKDTMYRKLFTAIGTKKVCGLTATPFRLDNKFFGQTYTGCIKMLNRMTLNSFFREIVCKVEMADLINQGYLTEPTYHTFETDLSGLILNTTGRDYTEDSLQEWGNRRLDQFMHVAEQLDEKHKRVLVFCTSIKQSEKAQERLKQIGIEASIITGKTPKKKRTEMLSDFQSGKIKWMLNVGVLTTGFDMPVLDAVVLLRPTFSVPLYIQILGRCLRLDPENPNKEAHFYDFTGTVEKFGRAETIRVVKEDGFKDMLMSEVGRIDNTELFSFDLKDKKLLSISEKPEPQALPLIEHPKEITIDYLLSLI